MVKRKQQPFPVANDDPRLIGLLDGVIDDPTAGLALADWLEERGDPRADSVRDLYATGWVIPEVDRWERARPCPMACGRYWSVAMRSRSVHAHAGSLLAELSVEQSGRSDVTVRFPNYADYPET